MRHIEDVQVPMAGAGTTLDVGPGDRSSSRGANISNFAHHHTRVHTVQVDCERFHLLVVQSGNSESWLREANFCLFLAFLFCYKVHEYRLCAWSRNR